METRPVNRLADQFFVRNTVNAERQWRLPVVHVSVFTSSLVRNTVNAERQWRLLVL